MDKRELILRALTDLSFRRKLSSEPREVLGIRSFTDRNRQEVDAILSQIRQIESQIDALADKLLCADGGPCGIA